MIHSCHPNVQIIRGLDLYNLDSCADLFDRNFVWHYFNSKWPDLHGDYLGVSGLKRFFNRIQKKSGSSFTINPLDVRAIGDELVVIHVCNRLELPKSEGGTFEFDAVVIWRIVNGRLAEAWDIPALHRVRSISRHSIEGNPKNNSTEL